MPGVDTTAPHSGAGARAAAPARPVLPFVAFTVACYLVAPYLGLTSFDVDPRIAELWPPGGVGFLLLATVWAGGRRTIAVTVAAMAVVFALTGLGVGYAVGPALWMAVVSPAQALAMVVIYRRRGDHTHWAPSAPTDVAVLLGAAVTTSLLAGLAGGFPGVGIGEIDEVLGWWVLRNSVFCFVGGAVFLLLFFAPRSDVLPASHWLNRVGLLATAVVCLWGTYLDPLLPLSWLVILPCVWGGLTLTPRGTGWLVLLVALVAAALTYLPQNHFGYETLFPASSIVDLLLIASTVFALLLTLLREQRARLIGELDRRGAEAESQRTMLASVFDSMHDGVIVLADGEVSLHNAAARRLLGRSLPDGPLGSWLGSLGLRDDDGRDLDAQAVLRHLLAAPSLQAPPVPVRVGTGRASRILDVRAQALDGDGSGPSAMILLHDVTSQRARMQELGNFAGVVAHDLRGPLTVLDGWLEVVQDEDEVPAGGLSDEALSRARDASHRMRQVIEDWLTYTVVQEGQLRSEEVVLDVVAQEVADALQLHGGEDEPATVTLDLTHVVRGDPGMLRQLLDNLVGNAIKYTPSSRAPEVQVVSRVDDEPGWVRVEVTDNGIGVPEGQEESIFEEFHRGPDEGRSAGTGLGLSLARRIVALHGGRLAARRNTGGGSTFWFTLPQG